MQINVNEKVYLKIKQIKQYYKAKFNFEPSFSELIDKAIIKMIEIDSDISKFIKEKQQKHNEQQIMQDIVEQLE
jgi:hypothetical protein